MVYCLELLFRAQIAMLGTLSGMNEKIKKLEREVHDLQLLKGELMNAKNMIMRERNANRQRVYELESELKELKSKFASLGKQSQLAETPRDVKKHELATIARKVLSSKAAVDEKERDLQKPLLKCVGLEQLFGLVINRECHLNPHLGRVYARSLYGLPTCEPCSIFLR